MTRFLGTGFILLTLLASHSYADEVPFPKETRSYVAVTKSKDGDNRFIFLLCESSICTPIHSKIGYTSEQILSMHPTLKKWGAVGLGILEVAVIVGVGVGPMVATGVEYLVFVAPVTIGVGGGAIYYFDAINPVQIYKNASREGEMQDAVAFLSDSMNKGESARILFASSNLPETLDIKARIEKALSRLD
jgi:hypothetical protein